jgi:hypothetical protein
MHAYRAYMIRWDGHIIYRVDIECDDDEAAKERAKLLVNGHGALRWSARSAAAASGSKHGSAVRNAN